MRALLLTRHCSLGPSTRYRALQYWPYLQARGWEVEWRSLLPTRYLSRFYRTGRRPVSDVCAGYARRFLYLLSSDLRAFDVVYVQSELFPYLPFPVESWFARNCRSMVLDFDDAVFVGYQRWRFLRNKIPSLLRSAGEVIVGNENLYEYARPHNDRVSMIPTVIDASRYEPKVEYGTAEGKPFVIGWIGTSTTANYLLTIAPVLRRLSERYRIVLRCIGAPTGFDVPGVPLECVGWSEETEATAVRGFDAGVMPLADEPFARGKCGLKLIQYMGAGVPAVGARLGANVGIITHGVDGFLASTADEYSVFLEALILDAALRARIGRAGRETVEVRYSLGTWADRFCGVIERAARSPSGRPS